MGKREEIEVGQVYVDAGMVWVGDPSYVMGEDATGYVKTWDGFVEKVSASDHFDSDTGTSEPLGKGVGIAVTSGVGDGIYPVTVVVEDGIVQSMTIRFMDD